MDSLRPSVAYKVNFMNLITSIIVGLRATGGLYISSNVLRPWQKYIPGEMCLLVFLHFEM